VLLRLDAPDDDARAALASTYLFHLGYAALQAAHYQPGHEVAVIGHGALGFTTASLVRAFGGHPVVFTGRAGALATGDSCEVRDKTAPPASFWQARAGIDGADVVVNTADGWSEHRLSLAIARKRGTVVLLGFPGRDQPPPEDNPLDSRFVYDKQLTLRHAGQVPELDVAASDIRFTLKRNLGYLARLLAEGRLDASPLLSLRLPAAELARAYDLLEKRLTPSLSVLLEW
jgi:threonine dehydrogenase-like Zn-dependent dehydrogenase